MDGDPNVDPADDATATTATTATTAAPQFVMLREARVERCAIRSMRVVGLNAYEQAADNGATYQNGEGQNRVHPGLRETRDARVCTRLPGVQMTPITQNSQNTQGLRIRSADESAIGAAGGNDARNERRPISVILGDSGCYQAGQRQKPSLRSSDQERVERRPDTRASSGEPGRPRMGGMRSFPSVA